MDDGKELVDRLADTMHREGVRELGGVGASWEKCRSDTRKFWRREARRVLGGVVASLALRKVAPPEGGR